MALQAPVPLKQWDGVLDASKVHGVCPQRNIYTRSEVIEGEEDCLYLNVYVPKDAVSSIHNVQSLVLLLVGSKMIISYFLVRIRRKISFLYKNVSSFLLKWNGCRF